MRYFHPVCTAIFPLLSRHLKLWLSIDSRRPMSYYTIAAGKYLYGFGNLNMKIYFSLKAHNASFLDVPISKWIVLRCGNIYEQIRKPRMDFRNCTKTLRIPLADYEKLTSSAVKSTHEKIAKSTQREQDIISCWCLLGTLKSISWDIVP